jgi:hypothetical protein
MKYLLSLFFTLFYFQLFAQDCEVDSINPYYVNFNANVTLSCSDDLSSVIPEVFDDCDTLVDLVYYEEISAGSCPGSINIFRVYRSFDDHGNQAVESQNIYIVDETPPFISGVSSEVILECGSQDTIAYPTIIDNCSSEIALSYQDSEIETFGCDSSFYRTWTASDECGNSSYFTQIISFLDVTEPVIENCPPDLILNPDEILPDGYEISVYDNCDQNLSVVYEEFYIGDTVSTCSILTPIASSGGNCDIIVNGNTVDWGMQLINLPTAHRYYTVELGQLTHIDSNSIRINATLINSLNNQNGFLLDATFSGAYSWNEWSSLPYPTSFKADCNGEDSNHPFWTYYIMDNNDGAELIGFGEYTGSSISLTHAPANQYFGFQYGDGANNYNSSNNGFGGWFNYSGTFTSGSGQFTNVYGAGDFSFDTDCGNESTLFRQWTVTDCSGNSSLCVQRVQFTENIGSVNEGFQFDNLTSKEVDRKEEILIQNTPEGIFLKNLNSKNINVEIYDINGKKIFGQSIPSENKIGFVLSGASSGIYTCVYSGDNFIKAKNFLIEK